METEISTIYKSILYFKRNIGQSNNIIIITIYNPHCDGDWRYDYYYLIDKEKGKVLYKNLEVTRIN